MSENDYARLEVDKVILHSQLPPDEFDAVSRNYVDTADAGVKSYVDGKVAALVDSAPSTLNTLKEIAQALNNDANLASTLVASIASESTARSVADAALQSSISALSLSSANALIQEAAARSQAIAQAVGDISETTSSLRSDLDSEISNRGQAIAQAVGDISETTSSLQSLNAEVSRATAADNDHVSRLNGHDSSISNLDSIKMNKSGGNFSGEVMMDSYLKFGPNWRVKGSADGVRLVFQHMKADGVWRNAVPFIASSN